MDDEEASNASFFNSTAPSSSTNQRLDSALVVYQWLSESGFGDVALHMKRRLLTSMVPAPRYDYKGAKHPRSFKEYEKIVSLTSNKGILENMVKRLNEQITLSVPPPIPGIDSVLFGNSKVSITRSQETMTRSRRKPRSLLHNLDVDIHSVEVRLNAREISGRSTMSMLDSSSVQRLQRHFRICGHHGNAYCVAFDRSGRYIITGGDDGLIKVWDGQTGYLQHSFRGHHNEVSDICISQCNQLIISGSVDKSVRLWCLQSARHLRQFTEHTASIVRVAFLPYASKKHPKMRFFVSCAYDCKVIFGAFCEDAKNFYVKDIFEERDQPGSKMISMCYSPCGRYVACGDSKYNIKVFHITEDFLVQKLAEIPHAHNDKVDSIDWANSKPLFVSGSPDGSTRMWSPNGVAWSSTEFSLFEEPSLGNKKIKVTTLKWTLDDRFVITASSDCLLRVLDPYNSKMVRKYKLHTQSVYTIKPHPVHANIFFSSGHDGILAAWDVDSPSEAPVWKYTNNVQHRGEIAIFDIDLVDDGAFISIIDAHGQLSLFGLGENSECKKVPKEQFFTADGDTFAAYRNWIIGATPPEPGPPQLLGSAYEGPWGPEHQRHVPGRENLPADQLMLPRPVDPSPWTEHRKLCPPISVVSRKVWQEDMSMRGEEETREFEAYKRANAARIADAAIVQANDLARTYGSRRAARMLGIGPQRSLPARRLFSSQALTQSAQRRNAIVELAPTLAYVPPAPLAPNPPREPSPPNGILPAYNSEDDVTYRVNSDDAASSDTDDSDYVVEERNNQSAEAVEEPQEQVTTTSSGRRVVQRRPMDVTASPARSRRRAVIEDDSSDDQEEEEEDEESENEDVAPDENLVDDNEPSTSNPQPSTSQAPTSSRKKPKAPVTSTFPAWMSVTRPLRFPYFAQLGDKVVFFRQGYEFYLKNVEEFNIYTVPRSQWPSSERRDDEVCIIDELRYVRQPHRLAVATLSQLGDNGRRTGIKWTVKFHDVDNLPDFLVPYQLYERSVASGLEEGSGIESIIDGKWWTGTVQAVETWNAEFPNSTWNSVKVRWDSGDDDVLSPWEVQPRQTNRRNDSSATDQDILDYGAYGVAADAWPTHDRAEMTPEEARDYNCDRLVSAITNLREYSTIADFNLPVSLETYPNYALVIDYPIDLSTIVERLNNRFYRNIHAVYNEIRRIGIATKQFNEATSTIVRNSRILIEALIRFSKDPQIESISSLYESLFTEPPESIVEYKNRTMEVVETEETNNAENLPESLLSEPAWVVAAYRAIGEITKCAVSKIFYDKSLSTDEVFKRVLTRTTDIKEVERRLLEGRAFRRPQDVVQEIEKMVEEVRMEYDDTRHQYHKATITLTNLLHAKMRPSFEAFNRRPPSIGVSTLRSRRVGRELRRSRRHQIGSDSSPTSEAVREESPAEARRPQPARNAVILDSPSPPPDSDVEIHRNPRRRGRRVRVSLFQHDSSPGSNWNPRAGSYERQSPTTDRSYWRYTSESGSDDSSYEEGSENEVVPDRTRARRRLATPINVQEILAANRLRREQQAAERAAERAAAEAANNAVVQRARTRRSRVTRRTRTGGGRASARANRNRERAEPDTLQDPELEEEEQERMPTRRRATRSRRRNQEPAESRLLLGIENSDDQEEIPRTRRGTRSRRTRQSSPEEEEEEVEEVEEDQPSTSNGRTRRPPKRNPPRGRKRREQSDNDEDDDDDEGEEEEPTTSQRPRRATARKRPRRYLEDEEEEEEDDDDEAPRRPTRTSTRATRRSVLYNEVQMTLYADLKPVQLVDSTDYGGQQQMQHQPHASSFPYFYSAPIGGQMQHQHQHVAQMSSPQVQQARTFGFSQSPCTEPYEPQMLTTSPQAYRQNSFVQMPVRAAPPPATIASAKHLAVTPDDKSVVNGVSEEMICHWMPTSWVERNSDNDELTYVCLWGMCIQSFQSREIFVDHLHAHIELLELEKPEPSDDFQADKSYKCRVRGCQKSVASIYDLQRHLTMHIFQADCQHSGSEAMAEKPETKNLECCGFDPLINVHYDGEVLICQWYECGRPFTSVPALFEHVTSHSDVLTDYDRCPTVGEKGEVKNLYACRWGSCSQFFDHKSSLKRHIKHHSGEKCLACPFCARFFSRKDKLVEHALRRAHINEDSTLKCKLCQKTFGTERLLCLHMTRHISNYQCPLCGLGVGNRSDMHRHLMLKHSSRSKDHICEVCEKAFYSESELNRHSVMHADDQYKCTECGETFRWRKQWMKHKKSHDENFNNNPYMCHLCDRSYTASFSLSRHLTKAHNCAIPDGFSRYSYKKCSDGNMRLQTSKMFRHEIEEATSSVSSPEPPAVKRGRK